MPISCYGGFHAGADSARSHVPRLARRRDQPVPILGQQQPLGNQSIRDLGQSRGPAVTR